MSYTVESRTTTILIEFSDAQAAEVIDLIRRHDCAIVDPSDIDNKTEPFATIEIRSRLEPDFLATLRQIGIGKSGASL